MKKNAVLARYQHQLAQAKTALQCRRIHAAAAANLHVTNGCLSAIQFAAIQRKLEIAAENEATPGTAELFSQKKVDTDPTHA